MRILKLATPLIFGAATFSLMTPAFAADNNCDSILKNIPGTYKLVKRTMPDGTVLSGSNVYGTDVYTKSGNRVTTVVIRDKQNIFSASVQSKYSINARTFSDSLDALVLLDGTAQPIYNFSQPIATAPVLCKDGKLTIQNPPYEPLSSLTFTKTGETAVLNQGASSGAIDEWKKIG